MAEQILNGADGGGYRAKVDSKHRLYTKSVTESAQGEALHEGFDWNVETGYLTLTTANASDLMYFKNTSDENIIVSLYVFLIKASTGGSGDLLVSILRNPTGGTVVTDANAANAVNMHFGSSEVVPATVYYGGEGKTLTGHDNSIVSKTTADNRFLLPILTELSKGSSFGIRVTPPTGNTSMDINVVVEVYKES